jgi:hypothetical protein
VKLPAIYCTHRPNNPRFEPHLLAFVLQPCTSPPRHYYAPSHSGCLQHGFHRPHRHRSGMPGRRHSGTPRSEYLTTKAVQTRPSTRLFTRMDTASSGHAGNGFGTNTATTSANHVKPRMMCPSTWPPIVQHVAAQQTERRTLSIKYANGDPAAALIKL